MVQINVKQVAEAKRINKSQLSLRAQVGIGVVRRYWDNQTKSVDLQIIDKFCTVLECEPGDLLIRIAS